MTYAAQIIGPAAYVRHLFRGVAVEPCNGTIYAHPSAARRAIDAYSAKHPDWNFHGRVVKLSDPEWREP